MRLLFLATIPSFSLNFSSADLIIFSTFSHYTHIPTFLLPVHRGFFCHSFVFTLASRASSLLSHRHRHLSVLTITTLQFFVPLLPLFSRFETISVMSLSLPYYPPKFPKMFTLCLLSSSF